MSVCGECYGQKAVIYDIDGGILEECPSCEGTGYEVRCVMCNRGINLKNYDEYEYGEDEDVWCISCCERESDTGEVF